MQELKRVQIVPSLLAADFANLKEELRKVERAGSKRLHLDVMDGHFVPNISFGPPVISSVRKATTLYLQSHLMIERPERYIEEFARVGCDCIIIHQEACRDVFKALSMIRKLGLETGVALRPKTPVSTIKDIIDKVDIILVMTVEPGFGGQEYISGSEKKVSQVRKALDEKGLNCALGVDGGINAKTIPLVAAAGATHLIAGSSVFKGDAAKNIKNLSKIIHSLGRL